MEIWQVNGKQQGETAALTKQFMQDVRICARCEHKRLDYYLAQFLEGHGRFGIFTEKINITVTSQYAYCQAVGHYNKENALQRN